MSKEEGLTGEVIYSELTRLDWRFAIDDWGRTTRISHKLRIYEERHGFQIRKRLWENDRDFTGEEEW